MLKRRVGNGLLGIKQHTPRDFELSEVWKCCLNDAVKDRVRAIET